MARMFTSQLDSVTLTGVIVHSIKSLTSFTKRGESMVEVTTGCRESLTLVQPRGASLLDIGVSGWHSDVTCEACKNQAKTQEGATA